MRNEANNKSEPGTSAQVPDAEAVERQNFYETMLRERRKFIRGIPVPHAMESNSDTDWAAFSDLMDDKPAEGEST